MSRFNAHSHNYAVVPIYEVRTNQHRKERYAEMNSENDDTDDINNDIDDDIDEIDNDIDESYMNISTT